MLLHKPMILYFQVICSEYRQILRDAMSLLNNGKHLRARTQEHYVFCWNLKRPKCIIHRSFMLGKKLSRELVLIVLL